MTIPTHCQCTGACAASRLRTYGAAWCPSAARSKLGLVSGLQDFYLGISSQDASMIDIGNCCTLTILVIIYHFPVDIDQPRALRARFT